MEGYERVDLSLFYNGFEDSKIALQVRNVFDERYLESASFANIAQFGSPTAVLLTVRIDLDGLVKGFPSLERSCALRVGTACGLCPPELAGLNGPAPSAWARPAAFAHPNSPGLFEVPAIAFRQMPRQLHRIVQHAADG